MIDRKPLAAAPPRDPVQESRDPHSIRFTPSEWDALCRGARRRGEEPSRFVRKLAMYALRIADVTAAREDSLGITAIGGL